MKYLFVLVIVISCGWKSKSGGYSDLDLLYSDFVKVLREDNDSKLKEYCYRITPDAGTVEYMKQNNFSYRGIPEQLDARKMKVTAIGDEYFRHVAGYRDNLKKYGKLENLKYIGRERDGEEIYNKELNISATETFIRMSSGNDTIRCKLGEMFRINGVWKSFTAPKLGW